MVHINGNDASLESADRSSICEDEEMGLMTDEIENNNAPSTENIVISNPATIEFRNISSSTHQEMRSTDGGREMEGKTGEENEEQELDEVPPQSRRQRYMTGIKTLLKTSLLDLKLFFWYGIL